jgi:hypothetical protein
MIQAGHVDPNPIREELAAVYGAVADDVSRAGPVCRLSGRCCRFEEYGHTLFLSAVEFAVLLADAPAPSRPLDHGASCPWQDFAGRCTAREARPLGCRIYYCDEGYQEQAAVLSERYIAQLKRLTDSHELPWSYAPLHRHLADAALHGSFPGRGRQPVGPDECVI